VGGKHEKYIWDKKDKSSIEHDIDGKLFRTNKLYHNQEKALDEVLEHIEEIEEKSSLPLYLSIIEKSSLIPIPYLST
jgi:hypothetical protein